MRRVILTAYVALKMLGEQRALQEDRADFYGFEAQEISLDTAGSRA